MVQRDAAGWWMGEIPEAMRGVCGFSALPGLIEQYYYICGGVTPYRTVGIRAEDTAQASHTLEPAEAGSLTCGGHSLVS